MSLTALEKEQLLDEAHVLIEEMGGVGALLDGLASRRKLSARMNEIYADILAQYPDKWVALGGADVLAVGDSMDEALSAMENLGIDRSAAVVRFMDTNPPILIL